MSKGVVLGGYQISNVLVAILLVASTTGAGVATDSFSGISEGFDNPLSGPSDNVTQNNQTDDSTDGMDDDSPDNQDSSDDGSDSSDSDSGDGSDSDSSDSSDSEDDGGFLDDILGGDEQDSENQTDEQDNQNQDETQDNETDDTTDPVNDTDPDTGNATAEITDFNDPRSLIYDNPYETASVPLYIQFSGENAEYEIWLDGESYLTGQVSETETVNQTMELSRTGEHDLEVKIRQNGEVVQSESRTFEVASSAIQETGFTKTTTVRTGSDATFRLVENGESVADATVYLGDQQGQTDQDGKVTFSIPYQETVTLSTDYSGIQDQTFNVTQDIPEPDITLTNPIDTASFDTPTGTDRDVTFEADVEISEDSGTASVMIDGSEAYTQDLSSGTSSISTTQALSGGTHNWQVEVDTPEYNVSSSSRSLTVNEVEVENGLSLKNNATAGEYNYVRLYDSGEPVEGEEITVNSDSIGTTDSNGEVGFEVPNVQEITVSASGYDSITQSVDGYTEEIDMAFSFSDTIYQGRSNTLTVTDQGSGDALNDATVYVNGVEQEGQTDPSGQITFTVPEENSVTVKAVKDNSDDNQSFTAEVPPVQVDWFSPSDSAQINDYSVDFDFNLDLTESGTATLFIEGSNEWQKDVGSGFTSVTETIDIVNSGSKSYELEVQTPSETFSRTGRFETTEDMPPIRISIMNITEGESVNDYKKSTDIGFESPEDFSYTTSVNSRTLSTGRPEQQDITLNEVANCLPQGDHQFTVEATGESTGRTFQESVSFSTEQTTPLADIVVDSPGDGSSFRGDLRAFYQVTACQSLDLNVNVQEDTGSTVQNLQQNYALSEYEEYSSPGDGVDLNTGDYQLNITAATGSNSIERLVDFTVTQD